MKHSEVIFGNFTYEDTVLKQQITERNKIRDRTNINITNIPPNKEYVHWESMPDKISYKFHACGE